MKRREFVKSAAALPLAVTGTLPGSVSDTGRKSLTDEDEFYELRRYAVRHGRPQSALESYLEEALIPGLNRAGIAHVGVFTEYGTSTPILLYVLMPHQGLASLQSIPAALATDTEYQSGASAFESRSSQEAVYSRYDTWLLRAFHGMPRLTAPDTSRPRIFELRTYEGHNDDAVTRKVAMFDTEEIDLFHRTGLTPVFFGRMIAGPRMPALTYMLTFDDMADRDANWIVFQQHPDWATMRVRPEYADTVSNIIRVFLVPTSYSQI